MIHGCRVHAELSGFVIQGHGPQLKVGDRQFGVHMVHINVSRCTSAFCVMRRHGSTRLFQSVLSFKHTEANRTNGTTIVNPLVSLGQASADVRLYLLLSPHNMESSHRLLHHLQQLHSSVCHVHRCCLLKQYARPCGVLSFR